MLIEESYTIGYFGQALDAYNVLMMLSIPKGDLIETYMIIERARSPTLIEQLTYTTFNPPFTVHSLLLQEEEQWNSELHPLA